MTTAYLPIFATVASGAGYGLIALMAIFQAAGILPPDRGLGAAGFGIAVVLITAALAGSIIHPGQPRRRWGSIGTWITTWPGREGLFALLTYLPAGTYAAFWCFPEWRTPHFTVIGMLAAMLGMQTVYCTAMSYAVQTSVRAWFSARVPFAYFALSVMTGALILQALATGFGYFDAAYFWVATLTIVLAGIIKMRYWVFIDRDPDDGAPEDVLLHEHGYHVAREHADRLRQLAIAAGFAAPILLVTLANVSPATSATVLTILAAVLTLAGILIERWLFLAEALIREDAQ